MGSLVSAGLPNITGSIDGLRGGKKFSPTGAIVKGDDVTYAISQGYSNAVNPTYTYIDASASNNIYGSSDTVVPESLITNFYIKY